MTDNFDDIFPDNSDNSDNKSIVIFPDDNKTIDKNIDTSEMGWGQIVDSLMDTVSEQDHLPDDVIRATEYLLAGYPIHVAARKMNKRPETIRRWLSKYPIMAKIVADGKQLLSKWRLAKLEQQFLTAIDVSEEVLTTPMNSEDVDPKILTVVAAQSRYIIGLFAGQKSEITHTHEIGASVLKAKQDALDYIADQLRDQSDNSDVEPIEVSYRVISEHDSGPFLNEDGKAPHGEIGVLDINEEGTLCHICGRRIKYLGPHVLTQHGIGTTEYENLYLLDSGALKASEPKKE